MSVVIYLSTVKQVHIIFGYFQKKPWSVFIPKSFHSMPLLIINSSMFEKTGLLVVTS